MYLMYLKVYEKHRHFFITCTDRTDRYVVYLSCVLYMLWYFTLLFNITVIHWSGGVIVGTTFPSPIALVIVNMVAFSVVDGSFHVATIVSPSQCLILNLLALNCN